MRIVTWNINSVRLRLDLVLRLIDQQQPDVLCLQETKAVDEVFPTAALAEREGRYYSSGICVGDCEELSGRKTLYQISDAVYRVS